MTKKEIISDFEELLKAKEFQITGQELPYICTYEQICNALKNEYIDNIESKVARWINISNVLYFENVKPIKAYFQAKMLFRDGFFEAAITLSRSICEMICYELLSKIKHPFGEYEELELENFRTLVKFLAIPKSIEKKIFQDSILIKINTIEDKNFLKSAYVLDSDKKNFIFQIEHGKNPKTLNRFIQIFNDASFEQKDNFPKDCYEIINHVYDRGNVYVHARKSKSSPHDDAMKNLNDICEILFQLYGVRNIQQNQPILSGYLDFPDICKGMNFALDIYETPEEAQRGYLNLPSKGQLKKLLSTVGDWRGQWQANAEKPQTGKLIIYMDGEYLKADLIYSKKKSKITSTLDIKFYGDYFRVKEFDPMDMKFNPEKHLHFELGYFDNITLIGKNLTNKGYVLFKKCE